MMVTKAIKYTYTCCIDCYVPSIRNSAGYATLTSACLLAPTCWQLLVGTCFIAVCLGARDVCDSIVLYYCMALFQNIKILTFINFVITG